jgi:hypothetical protein
MVNFDHRRSAIHARRLVSFSTVRRKRPPYAHVEAIVALPKPSLAMGHGAFNTQRSAVASSQRSKALDIGQQDNGSAVKPWSRRRLGLLAGGLTASLLGLKGPLTSVSAKKGKKRERRAPQTQGATCPTPPVETCAPVRGKCVPGQSRCCDALFCLGLPSEELDPTIEDFFCCRDEGEPCSSGTDECCRLLGLGCVSGTCQLLE